MNLTIQEQIIALWAVFLFGLIFHTQLALAVSMAIGAAGNLRTEWLHLCLILPEKQADKI